jgi:DNA-binding transcriptional LysR family regulator
LYDERVELRHLAALAAVVEHGSFGRAAARLGYTQSTVSQQVAALEKAVGGPLFDRPGGPRPVRLTALGAVVLAHGRELLARSAELTTAVDRFLAGDGRVDIGTFQSVSNVILPHVVRTLRDEHPGCDIRLFEEETDRPEIDDLDLLFFDGVVAGDVAYRKLLDDPYVLVAPRGAYRAGPVDLTVLDGAPMVAQRPICAQARLEEEFVDRGVSPRFVFRTVGNEAVLSMVRAGLGVAVLPRLIVLGAGVDGDRTLRTHPLRPAPTAREIFLHWPAGRTHSPLAARAMAVAIDVTARI